jgi:hypothetical protein
MLEKLNLGKLQRVKTRASRSYGEHREDDLVGMRVAPTKTVPELKRQFLGIDVARGKPMRSRFPMREASDAVRFANRRK